MTADIPITITATQAKADELRAQNKDGIICTMDAFLYGVLLQADIRLTLITRDQQTAIIKEIVRKQETNTYEEIYDLIFGDKIGMKKQKGEAVLAYKARLQADGVMDLDDMTIFFDEQLIKNSIFREMVQLRYQNLKVVQIDKFNAIQKRILLNIPLEKTNVPVKEKASFKKETKPEVSKKQKTKNQMSLF